MQSQNFGCRDRHLDPCGLGLLGEVWAAGIREEIMMSGDPVRHRLPAAVYCCLNNDDSLACLDIISVVLLLIVEHQPNALLLPVIP